MSRSLLTLSLLCPVLAWAQSSGHQLDTVRVDDGAAAAPVTPTTTDGRLGLSERETPATVSTVDREDIEQLGLRNLIELYRSAPGVAA
ncbi:MAG: TonB-dependent receptor plug domain-containing protein, partial [Pseudomonadota bacterium]|nr:TonB-dependent receptor plug domain-containing protein [Pseudomonadota bacterium]